MKTITLDLDDFSIENTNLYYLEKLREIYPRIKISMFYIPADMEYFNRLDNAQKEQSKNMIRIAVAEGWIELIPHGVTHLPSEFKKATYEDMQLAMKAYEEHFKVIDCPYIKGFKAPYWEMSKDAIRCLDDNGWFLATDLNQPQSPKAKINYVYNWDIADSFPKDKEVVKAHGHINLPSKNNLVACMKNLSHIPPDYTWEFVSSIVAEENDKSH
jgi:hypothetical protein